MKTGYPLPAWVGAFLVLALVPVASLAFDEPFYIEAFGRGMILALAAVSLDLIVGRGGLISFGHAVYLGIGGYAVGILSFYGLNNGWLHFLVALGASAIFALLVACVSLRMSGAYFIMITLAFAQLLYFTMVSLQVFGADDGMPLKARSAFAGLDLYDNVQFYYLTFALLVLTVLVLLRLTRSRFGVALDGIRQNERRMIALGVRPFRYKLVAFVIAGALCGLAGALLANHTEYVSPAVMHWSRSGDLLVMVIFGGVGSLLGPVVGAVAFVILEIVLSGYSKHWHIAFGLLLVVLALGTHRGLLDLTGVGARLSTACRKLPWRERVPATATYRESVNE